MKAPGVSRILAAGAACAALLLQPTGAPSAQPNEQHFQVRHGKIIVDVQLSERPVSMRSFGSHDWSSATAPVIVRVRGNETPVTLWATPAYGGVDLPGRHVHVTYLTRYRADGDPTDATPLYDGAPLMPDARKTEGTANIELSITNDVQIRLVLDVRNGAGTTHLREKGDPAKSVAFSYTST